MMRKMWGLRWAAVRDVVHHEEWARVETTAAEEAVAYMGKAARWEEEVASRKFRWAGHIARREASRRTTRIMRMQETATRARAGHPKTRWENTMHGMMGDGWQDVANDRYWRRLFCEEIPNWIRGRLN